MAEDIIEEVIDVDVDGEVEQLREECENLSDALEGANVEIQKANIMIKELQNKIGSNEGTIALLKAEYAILSRQTQVGD